MLRARWPVAVFVVWSLYVWVTRIVNAVGGDEDGQLVSVVLALSVLVPAVATGAVLVRARSRELTEPEARLLSAFAGWTALVWLVRGAEIVLSDHEVGFKVVHVALGVISIALAAATVRVARAEARAGGFSLSVGAGR